MESFHRTEAEGDSTVGRENAASESHSAAEGVAEELDPEAEAEVQRLVAWIRAG